MAKETNCLILDEPSNHLDPEALDRLEGALKNFKGTIIIVSHDRYLIDQIDITKTYLMENGKLVLLKDYHDYEKIVLSEK
jgi:ATP-binding cassette subfamily F protein 3